MSKVDLRELAVDRGGRPDSEINVGRRVVTRYLFPILLLLGFAALAGWAARDLLFPPIPVEVVPVLATRAEVTREGTQLFKAAGWVEPRPTAVRVAALSSGVVQKLLVVEDQLVKAGDPIAELVKEDAELSVTHHDAESRLREAELKEADAVLAAAVTRWKQPVHLQAQLGEAEIALAQIETQLKNLPHELKRAEAQLEYARQNFQGKSNSEGAVSGLKLAEAKSEVHSAEALVAELKDRRGSLEKERAAAVDRREALKTQLSLLADEIRAKDEAQAKVDAASSRLVQAKVAVAEAKLRLDRMTIRAPVDGRVFRLVAQPGTTLTGGAGASEQFDGSTVVTLYRPQMLQVRVDVRFEDIPQVSLGQQVQIENPALKQPLSGKVLFVSSFANIQKNTLEVKVGIESPPAVFKPEMLVNVTFIAPPSIEKPDSSQEKMRLYVPQEHVHRDETGQFVWIADQSMGLARRTPVAPGPPSGNGLVQIQSGVTIASRIIVTGIDKLTDGARIRVVGEAAEGSMSAHGVETQSTELHRLPQGESH